jgi:hypothetical protein
MTDKHIPAFPVQSIYVEDQDTNSRGMTLRDYFAAKALPVIMPDNREYPRDAAKAAYQFADAMMKARGA